MSNAVVPIQAPPTQVLSAQDIRSKLLEESGLSAEELNELRRTVRMPGGWVVDSSCPVPGFDKSHVIHSIFAGSAGDKTGDHSPGDVRVYAQPRSFVDADGDSMPWLRFVLNRSNSYAVRTDAMPMNAWIEDVGFELSASIVEDEDEPDEGTTCQALVISSVPGGSACGAVLEPDARYCHRCGAAVHKCPCGRYSDIGDAFCAACGKPVALAAP